MSDAGAIFRPARHALHVLVWRSRTQTPMRHTRASVGVRVAVIVSALFISLELVSAATLGRRAWGGMFSAPSSADVIRAQVMGLQFAFYFRYPGPDRQFGPIHVEKIDPSIANYFGLDRGKDMA